MITSAGAVPRREARDVRVGEAADVVDDRGAGGEHGLDDRRPPGVDGNAMPSPASARTTGSTSPISCVSRQRPVSVRPEIAPTSTIAAPWPRSSRPRATLASVSARSRPSATESRPQLRIPISSGRSAPHCSVPPGRSSSMAKTVSEEHEVLRPGTSEQLQRLRACGQRAGNGVPRPTISGEIARNSSSSTPCPTAIRTTVGPPSQTASPGPCRSRIPSLTARRSGSPSAVAGGTSTNRSRSVACAASVPAAPIGLREMITSSGWGFSPAAARVFWAAAGNSAA